MSKKLKYKQKKIIIEIHKEHILNLKFFIEEASLLDLEKNHGYTFYGNPSIISAYAIFNLLKKAKDEQNTTTKISEKQAKDMCCVAGVGSFTGNTIKCWRNNHYIEDVKEKKG